MILLWTMFVAGLLHGLGPDHLAALAALTGREHKHELESSQRRSRGTGWLGVRFALGHVVSLIALAAVLGWLGQDLPDRWQRGLEQLGGATLIFLGGWMLAELLRKGVTVHSHPHAHPGGHQAQVHSHTHLHLGSRPDSHHHPHVSWVVGGLLGFSGARALLTTVPLIAAGSTAAVVERALAFGAGIALSMMAAGWIAARLAALVASPWYARLLVGATGGLSSMLGLYWLAFPPGS